MNRRKFMAAAGALALGDAAALKASGGLAVSQKPARRATTVTVRNTGGLFSPGSTG
jgi:hypothetical protein